jgi:hypothetical protein
MEAKPLSLSTFRTTNTKTRAANKSTSRQSKLWHCRALAQQSAGAIANPVPILQENKQHLRIPMTDHEFPQPLVNPKRADVLTISDRAHPPPPIRPPFATPSPPPGHRLPGKRQRKKPATPSHALGSSRGLVLQISDRELRTDTKKATSRWLSSQEGRNTSPLMK